MRLRVRIEDWGAAGLPELQALWERCAAAINPPTIPDIEEVLYGVSYEATNGFARAIPALPPRPQDVIISQAIFALPPERQELTILHELLHLSIANGGLAQRWERERQRGSSIPILMTGSRLARILTVSITRRTALPRFYYFLTPDEILAERALRDGYRVRVPERLRQHIAMRSNNLNTRAQDGVHAESRKYWLALELQRTLMLIDVSDQGQERVELETIGHTYRELLIQDAGDAEAQQLTNLVDRINRYQVGNADAEAACDEAFAEIMARPYPEAAVARG